MDTHPHLKAQHCLPARPHNDHTDYQRAVHILRAAASDADQSDARRQWIRAATQC